jgi:hypothetical protein
LLYLLSFWNTSHTMIGNYLVTSLIEWSIRLLYQLSLRGSLIGWRPRLMKWKSLVRIPPPFLMWTCRKKKKKKKKKKTEKDYYINSKTIPLSVCMHNFQSPSNIILLWEIIMYSHISTKIHSLPSSKSLHITINI